VGFVGDKEMVCDCGAEIEITTLTGYRDEELTIECDMTRKHREIIARKLDELSNLKSGVFSGFELPTRREGFNPWKKEGGYQLPFNDEEYHKLMDPVNETAEEINGIIMAKVEGGEVVLSGDPSDVSWDRSPQHQYVSLSAFVCLDCKSVSLSAYDYENWEDRTNEYLSKIDIATDTLNEIGKLTSEIRNADAEEKKQAEITELETKLKELKD